MGEVALQVQDSISEKSALQLKQDWSAGKFPSLVKPELRKTDWDGKNSMTALMQSFGVDQAQLEQMSHYAESVCIDREREFKTYLKKLSAVARSSERRPVDGLVATLEKSDSELQHWCSDLAFKYNLVTKDPVCENTNSLFDDLNPNIVRVRLLIERLELRIAALKAKMLGRSLSQDQLLVKQAELQGCEAKLEALQAAEKAAHKAQLNLWRMNQSYHRQQYSKSDATRAVDKEIKQKGEEYSIIYTIATTVLVGILSALAGAAVSFFLAFIPYIASAFILIGLGFSESAALPMAMGVFGLSWLAFTGTITGAISTLPSVDYVMHKKKHQKMQEKRDILIDEYQKDLVTKAETKMNTALNRLDRALTEIASFLTEQSPGVVWKNKPDTKEMSTQVSLIRMQK